MEEETRRYRPTKNYLEHLPAPDHTPFETEVLKAEFDRMTSRLPMDMLSMKRSEGYYAICHWGLTLVCIDHLTFVTVWSALYCFAWKTTG